MTITAGNAIILTNNAITLTELRELQNEVARAEANILNATGRGLYFLRYDAGIIGNPPDDPNDDNNLTDNQVNFRDVFRDNGFIIDRDEDTGFWLLSWEEQGAEAIVHMYSVRTTVTPGAIVAPTIAAIDAVFDTVIPKVTVRTFLNPINGGDIDETDFNGTPSVFYEYVVLTQQHDATDYSNDILTALDATSLGYVGFGASKNVEVYFVTQ